jgi:hypothetical protein
MSTWMSEHMPEFAMFRVYMKRIRCGESEIVTTEV